MPPDMDRFDEVARPASPAPAPAPALAPAASRDGASDLASTPARVHGITATVVPVVQTTALGDRWADVVARLQSEGLITALVRELAVQAECVAVQDEPGMTVWTLRVERESLRGDMQRERLTQAVQKALGGDVRIELQAGVARDTPALRDQAARASRQAAAESLIKQDPLVNRLLEQYPGARVVPGSMTSL